MKHAAAALAAILTLQALAVPAQETLRRDVEYLSSPINGGRGFSTAGIQTSAFHILQRFRRNGLDARIHSFRTPDGRVGHNVIGTTKSGTSGKAVLVCAHYDSFTGSTGGFYPAADANASGVAALLSLADSLSGSGMNIVFAAFDGYTEGLAGAKAYANSSVKPSLVINLDTMGSTKVPPSSYRPDFVIILGGEKYEKSLSAANARTRLRLYYDYYGSRDFTRLFYRTRADHVPFLEKGVPCVMFTSGITMDTNKTTDTPESLDYQIYPLRVELIKNWIKILLSGR